MDPDPDNGLKVQYREMVYSLVVTMSVGETNSSITRQLVIQVRNFLDLNSLTGIGSDEQINHLTPLSL